MATSTTAIEVAAPTGPDDVGQGVARPGRRPRLLFVRNSKALVGIVILVFFGILAVVGPWIAPYDPDQVSTALLQPPSGAHWLGTDHTGRDILSQIIVGTRGVLVVGLVAGLGATALGVIVGVTAGFVGGLGDEGLSALSNVFLVITLSVLVANLVADLAYAALDPRTRQEG